MPELSSIVRGDPSDEDPALVTSFADLTLGEQNSLFDERIIPDVFSFFVLAIQFKIPHYDLPVGLTGSVAGGEVPQSVFLGHGTSSNVSVLRMEKDVSPDCPAGTLVACKRYHQAPQTTSGADQEGTERIHAWLLQELRVFCHPELRKHENICRLLFVGWDGDGNSLVPTLGLELATYNTLDDSMQQLRSYGTIERKTNLTIDIALGLHILHSLGLVHGDVKLGNIILCKHPSRGVVAKISDFSGAAPASTYASARFTTGTPVWQPPEAVLGERSIDWQLVDTYSFGMVIATIWYPSGWIPQGGSFLETRIRYYMTPDDKSKVILLHKLYPDYHPESPLRLAVNAVSLLGYSLPPLSLALLFTFSLSCQPSARLPIMNLVPLLKEQGTVRSSGLRGLPIKAVYDPSYWETRPEPGLIVIHHPYMYRSQPFKKKMLQTLLAMGNDMKARVSPIIARDIDENFRGSEKALRSYVRAEERRNRSQLWTQPELQMLGHIAINIAMSYLLGVGTVVIESLAIEWLALAAQCHEGNAQCWFCPLEESTGSRVQTSVPRRLWNTNAVRAGFCSNLSCLQTTDPGLATIAGSLTQKTYWGRSKLQIVHIEPYVERIMNPIYADHAAVDLEVEARPGLEIVGERALHVASALGRLDLVIYLVVEAQADINVTNLRNETPIFYATRANNPEIATFLLDHGAQVDHISTEGLSIAHCLSMMDDHYAADLLPRYLDRGASLGEVALDTVREMGDRISLGAGIPLMWAVFKNRPILLGEILKSHSRPQFQISPADYCILLTLLCSLNHYKMLQLAVQFYSSSVNQSLGIADNPNILQLQTRVPTAGSHPVEMDLLLEEPFRGITPANYTRLLLRAMDTDRRLLLDRRYLHRASFKQAKERTCSFLLKHGADPIQRARYGQPQSTALSYAIYTGDTTAFRLFITHLKEGRVELLPVLSNPENFGGYNALQRAIYSDSRHIFLILVEEYPELLQLKDEVGRGALQSAVTQEWPGYCEELLRRGASIYDRSRDRSTPFTWALMLNPTLNGARTVMEMMAVGADMNRLLGPDEKNGLTAFAKLANAMVIYKMNLGFDRLEYLVQKYGKPSFIADSQTGDSLITHLLMSKPPLSDTGTISTQAAMLRYIIQLFPDKINEGVNVIKGTALHLASALGNIACVEILLELGADIDIGALSEHGMTALGLAVHRMDNPPPRAIRELGSRETATFRKNLELIIAALIQKGAKTAGKGASASLELRVNNALDQGDARFQVVILGLPSSETSAIDPDNEWSRRLPWEGEGPAPYEPHDDGQVMVEHVHYDGLLHVTPESSYQVLEILNGFINPGMTSKGYVETRDPTPDGYARGIDMSIEVLKTIWHHGSNLPSGWEIRQEEKSGRIYFVDHNRRETSWDPPVVG